METKDKQRKQRLLARANYKPNVWVLSASAEISRCQAHSVFTGSKSRQWQSDRFPWFAFWIPLVIWVAHIATGTKTVGCCGNVPEVCLKLSTSVCRAHTGREEQREMQTPSLAGSPTLAGSQSSSPSPHLPGDHHLSSGRQPIHLLSHSGIHKVAILVLSDSKSKEGKKIRYLSWRITVR